MSRNESSVSKKSGTGLYVDDRILRWFAVYTVPRHEQQVSQHLDARGIEHFLPLYQVVHRWKNGVAASLALPCQGRSKREPGNGVKVVQWVRLKVLESEG
jgi:hypothetical protein